ncbi:MAG: EAL domain-containing protein [Pseudomonadota bacterium]
MQPVLPAEDHTKTLSAWQAPAKLFTPTRASDAGARHAEPAFADNANTVDNAERRRILEEAFATALSAGGVLPYYQPVVSLANGKISGWQSLARWDHPSRGIIGPGLFMHVFRDNDICMRLGKVMTAAICQDMARWMAEGLTFTRVGLRLTTSDLMRPDFADNVLEQLAAHSLAPRHLILEVALNELDAFSRTDEAQQLNRLRAAGCTVAVDGCRVGHGQSDMLRDVECDIIKIDRRQTANVTTCAADRQSVASIVAIAAEKGCATVAQGIESRAQSTLLRELGCVRGQGYMFGRPDCAAACARQMVSIRTSSGHRGQRTG